MNYKFLALLACASLAACGGGGSSGTTDTGTGTGTGTGGTTTPTNETDAVKVFAESLTAFNLAQSLVDLHVISGHTGSCPLGGTTSFSNQVQTVTNCVRDLPNDNAYTGQYGFANTGAYPIIPSVKLTITTDIKASTPSNLSNTRFTINHGTVSGATSYTTLVDTTQIQSDVSFTTGNSVYQVNGLLAVENNYTNRLSSPNFSYAKNNGALYSVSEGNKINIAGISNPNSGAYTVVESASIPVSLCSRIDVTFKSATDFEVYCVARTGNPVKYTKKWTDADIVAALAAAKQ
jgi:hypothetical protein